jgi:hypothetical protein
MPVNEPLMRARASAAVRSRQWIRGTTLHWVYHSVAVITRAFDVLADRLSPLESSKSERAVPANSWVQFRFVAVRPKPQ